jgi:hypothetical protein
MGRDIDARVAPSIGAVARIARQMAGGAWVTLELSATRAVQHMDPDDDAPEARRLGSQLHAAVEGMFAELEADEPAPAGPAVTIAAPPPPPRPPRGGPPDTLECPEHPGEQMRIRRRGDGSHFYSHNDESTGGSWCNYQPRTGGARDNATI